MLVLDCYDQRDSRVMTLPCSVKCSFVGTASLYRRWGDCMAAAWSPCGAYECYFCVGSSSCTDSNDDELTRRFYTFWHRSKHSNEVVVLCPRLGLSTGYKANDYVYQGRENSISNTYHRKALGRLMDWMMGFLHQR